jgi:hypothetical protein
MKTGCGAGLAVAIGDVIRIVAKQIKAIPMFVFISI